MDANLFSYGENYTVVNKALQAAHDTSELLLDQIKVNRLTITTTIPNIYLLEMVLEVQKKKLIKLRVSRRTGFNTIIGFRCSLLHFYFHILIVQPNLILLLPAVSYFKSLCQHYDSQPSQSLPDDFRPCYFHTLKCKKA